MKIITDTADLKLNNTCVTIGKFDGMHLGHRSLMEEMKKKDGCKKVVFTFNKSPRAVLRKCAAENILTDAEKQVFCRRLGTDIYICVQITQQFLNLPAEQFIEDVLMDKLGAVHVVIGENFCFGRNRSGDRHMLKEYSEKCGYSLTVVDNAEYEGVDVSSTRIKQELTSGDIRRVNDMLGYPYTVIGSISHGKAFGRKMELPTANIIPEKNKLLPPKGVYRTKVLLSDGSSLNAVSNVGVNPTVTGDGLMKVESHIIDFDRELYGETIEVQFFDFIRPEKKFGSAEELKRQINSDIEKSCIYN